MGIFKKRQYATVNVAQNETNSPNVPDGCWTKCNKCGKILYSKILEENNGICYHCHGYFRLGAYERIDSICDLDRFEEFNQEIKSNNIRNFPNYDKKLKDSKEKSGLNEGVVTGYSKIGGIKNVICVMDSNFMMGSMGAGVGEKITLAVEIATKENLPIIIFTTSGGARMQEGIISLMQMAKTSEAIAKLDEEGLLYISVLTDPTTGGVTASFASLGDIILAEPGTLIGFAGPRVIEQTIKQKLPEGFQSAEFLLEHGFIDKIVERKDMKNTLYNIVKLHQNTKTNNVR